MNAEILAIVNQKGGVGKSFSCITLNVFRTEIPHSVKAKESNAEGKSIYAYDDSCKVAQAYKTLIREVLILEKQREKYTSEYSR